MPVLRHTLATAIVFFNYQDGHIDFYEFMTVLHVMSRGSSEDNLRQIFRVFDINRDGKISKEELERIVEDFQLSNIEGGCLVNSGWLRRLADLTLYISTFLVFNEMDENEDGEITPEEFIEVEVCPVTYFLKPDIAGLYGSKEDLDVVDFEDN